MSGEGAPPETTWRQDAAGAVALGLGLLAGLYVGTLFGCERPMHALGIAIAGTISVRSISRGDFDGVGFGLLYAAAFAVAWHYMVGGVS